MQIASDVPDIMLCTEVISKAQKNRISEAQMKIEGYELYKNLNIQRQILVHPAFAIYVKDDINCKGIKLQSIFDDDVWVEISLRNGDNLLCGIYRNPTKGRAATTVSTEKVCEVIVEAVQKNR